MKYEFISDSIEQTQKFAKEFAKEIKPGNIVTLSGELGAGKTTFVQGFALELGITHRIISPTFVIIRTYNIQHQKSNIKNQNATRFYHIDLYRIRHEKELEGLGLSEILEDKEAIIVIEWPERMGALLPKKRVDIQIDTMDENTRKIIVHK